MPSLRSECIRVLYPDGRFAYHVPAVRARQMIHAGVAIGEGNKRSIHTLRLITGPSRPVAGTRYSHKRENKQRGSYAGVQNVWTLRKLDDGTRDGEAFAALVFRAVQLDCMASDRRGLD